VVVQLIKVFPSENSESIPRETYPPESRNLAIKNVKLSIRSKKLVSTSA
jgi:hypothetical protein